MNLTWIRIRIIILKFLLINKKMCSLIYTYIIY
jgi:hypothetical protein